MTLLDHGITGLAISPDANVRDCQAVLGYMIQNRTDDIAEKARSHLPDDVMPLQDLQNALTAVYVLGSKADPISILAHIEGLQLVGPTFTELMAWIELGGSMTPPAFYDACERIKKAHQQRIDDKTRERLIKALERGASFAEILDTLAAATKKQEPAPAPAAAPATRRETAAALLADPNVPDIRWFVPGVLREGLALLVGAPFIGKTPALVQLAIALAAGERWMGRFRCRPTRVLYVGTEYSRADVRKTLKDSLGREEAPEHLYIRTIENIPELPTPEILLAWLEAEMDETGAEVVILDVLTAILPDGRDWKKNVYRGDYQELKPYHTLGLHRHVCIVGGWHGSKRETDPALMYNGSTGMWGVAGGGRLVMYKDKEKNTRMATYTRGGEPLDMTLEQRLQNGWRRWAVSEESNTPAGLEGVQRAVYTALQTAPGPMGPGAIYDAVSSLVSSISSVHSALRQLAKKNLVVSLQGAWTVATSENGDSRDSDDLDDLGDLRGANISEDVDHRDSSVLSPDTASESAETAKITRITHHQDHSSYRSHRDRAINAPIPPLARSDAAKAAD